MRRWAFALGLLVAAAAISLVVVTLSQHHAVTIYASVVAPATALLGSILGFYFGTKAVAEPTDRDYDVETQLIDTVGKLERQLRMAVSEKRGVRSDETLATLVQDLLDRGVWQEQDAQDFRTAMAARNLLVHSGTSSDEATVRTQTELARRLLQALMTHDPPRGNGQGHDLSGRDE